MEEDVTPSVLPEVLNVLREIIREHRVRAARGEAACVVPILVAGFSTWIPMIKEILRAEGGITVEASTLRDGCDAEIDVMTDLAELRAALQPVEDTLDGLAISVDGSFVEVVGGGIGIDSDSLDVLRGILPALFHPSLRNVTLVALVLEEPALDEVVASAIWNALTELAQLLSLPVGHTVLIVMGDARVSIERHCVGDPSIRFNIREREPTLARRSMASCRFAINDVARLDKADAPLLFLFTGAGATAHLGLPTGNQLRDEALVNWLGEDADADEFRDQALRFYAELDEGGRLLNEERVAGSEAFIEGLTLERVLREEQHREHNRDSWSIRRFRNEHERVIAQIQEAVLKGEPLSPLGALVRSGRRIAITTVNFDRTLEAECGDAIRPFVNEHDFVELEAYLDEYAHVGGAVPYVKLHGDIDDADTIVANIDETTAGLSAARLGALRTLRGYDASIRPWLYVGYSMRDLDVISVIGATDAGDDLVEFWVGPFVDPSVRKFIETRRLPRWLSEGHTYTVEERCVTLTSNEYLALLVEGL